MENALKQTKSNILKIVFIGPESTGKTTICKAIAKQYNTIYVPEYARHYAETIKRPLTANDVLPIAKGQMQLENKLVKHANRMLFCDTNLISTKVYAELYYNFTSKVLNEFAIKNNYDLLFLTYIDVPWENDEVRDAKHNRELHFNTFKTTLETLNINYVLLKGTKQQRFKLAQTHINNLLQ